MKNNFYCFIVGLLISVFMIFTSYGLNGPFCSACNLVEVTHMSKAQYDAMVAGFESQVALGMNGLYAVYTGKISAQNNVDSIRSVIIENMNSGSITVACGEGLMNMLDSQNQYLGQIWTGCLDAWACYDGMAAAVRGATLETVEYCDACAGIIVDGGGGDDGGGGGTTHCDCPDYTLLLQEISSRISDLNTQVIQVNSTLNDIKSTLDAWYVKWQAQDAKLTPLIDELQPMLDHIKKFYDAFYDSGFGKTGFENLKWMLQDIKDKDVIKEFDKLLNDYNESSFNSASWSAMSVTAQSWERILTDAQGGESAIQNILRDYSTQKESAIGSYSKSSDIETEGEWLSLNWFQRITAGFGMMLFPKKRDDESEMPTIDDEKQKAEAIRSSVETFTTGISTGVNGVWSSYKNVYLTFKGIFNADEYPTTIRICGGFKFDMEGMDIPAIGAVAWDTTTTPLVKTGCDTIRAFCGLIWWILGFVTMFGLVRSVYSFLIGLVEKVLLVVGSMGRSGGSPSGA